LVESSDKLYIMQQFLLHSDMLAANGAVHDGGSRFDCNLARGARSNGAVNYRESRPVLINISHYVSNELPALKRETNMHNVTPGDRRGLIEIYAKGLISAFRDLQ
jgi:hypothetical protein